MPGVSQAGARYQTCVSCSYYSNVKLFHRFSPSQTRKQNVSHPLRWVNSRLSVPRRLPIVLALGGRTLCTRSVTASVPQKRSRRIPPNGLSCLRPQGRWGAPADRRGRGRKLAFRLCGGRTPEALVEPLGGALSVGPARD